MIEFQFFLWGGGEFETLFYAFLMHFLCISYIFLMHFLCMSYAFLMDFLKVHKKYMHFLQKCMYFLCTFKKCIKSA